MKHGITAILFGSFILMPNSMLSQYKYAYKSIGSVAGVTGNLNYDLSGYERGNTDSIEGSQIDLKKKYSPLQAGLMSAIVPGAGQFYTKTYWKSAVFFGAEVISWIIYASYENKADRSTQDFQKYANEHWSAFDYSIWMVNNYPAEAAAMGFVLPLTQTPGWSTINALETLIGGTTGTGFSHKLAPYGDQQYYEMIGKYAQFGGGWDDAATFQPGGFTHADIVSEHVSPNFLKYRDMRGDANSLYNIATTVSYVIVANHVFSALEAAWNASKINKKIELQGHIQSRRIYGNMVEFVPTLNIRCML